MPEEEKDKYDELEELGRAENQELEELPVEAVPEPFSERTEPMEGLVGQPQADSRETSSGAEDKGTELGKKIEEAASFRDASEYLKGQKQVRVIKKSAIKDIVDSIISNYSGIEHKDLLSKIAEYEFSISNLTQEKQRLADELEALRGEHESSQDGLAIKYEKEIRDLQTRVKTAEELLTQDSSKAKVARLEAEVLRLRQRLTELEEGLEFAAVVEDYDYGLAIESATEQKQKLAELEQMLDRMLEADSAKEGPLLLKQLLGALESRFEMLTGLFKEMNRSYAELFKKVDEKQGSVGVVAELVRLNARNRGWSRELEVCEQFVRSADAILKTN